MEETIEGYVDHIIFRNEDNGYTVMVVIAEEEELTCVGSFQYLSEGETIKAYGHYTEHPSYGRIVRRFKDDTLRIVEEEPERLAEIKGISEKKAREIAAQVSEKADMRKAMMFLQQYGISLSLGAKIFNQYGHEMYGILTEWDLRWQMRSLPGSASIQTPITVSEAVFYTYYCRQLQRGMCSFHSAFCWNGHLPFWALQPLIWKNILWIWL